MEEKLQKLYDECINELKTINIDEKMYGNITIKLSNRNIKRYGCCKQENPLKESKYIEKIGKRKFLRYKIFKKHIIEISKWVMQLNDNIIKNTIMHEIIHCFPDCNNHGKEFKRYSKIINEKLDYTISRLGNKENDYKKSNLEYRNEEKFKYKVECTICGQTFFRKRLKKNFQKKYKCGKCSGSFKVTTIL